MYKYKGVRTVEFRGYFSGRIGVYELQSCWFGFRDSHTFIGMDKRASGIVGFREYFLGRIGCRNCDVLLQGYWSWVSSSCEVQESWVREVQTGFNAFDDEACFSHFPKIVLEAFGVQGPCVGVLYRVKADLMLWDVEV